MVTHLSKIGAPTWWIEDHFLSGHHQAWGKYKVTTSFCSSSIWMCPFVWICQFIQCNSVKHHCPEYQLDQLVNGRPSTSRSTVLTELDMVYTDLYGGRTLAACLWSEWLPRSIMLLRAPTLKSEARWPTQRLVSFFSYTAGRFVPGNSHQPHLSCP